MINMQGCAKVVTLLHPHGQWLLAAARLIGRAELGAARTKVQLGPPPLIRKFILTLMKSLDPSLLSAVLSTNVTMGGTVYLYSAETSCFIIQALKAL